MLFVSDPTIDHVLGRYQSELGPYFDPYKNHVYRVFNLVFSIAGDDAQKCFKEIAIAAVFHDLGIWVDQTLDYLKPSIKLSFNYIKEQNLEVDRQLITEIIENHHRLRSYSYNGIVESFRKSDLIDLSRGMIHFGLKKEYIKQLYRSLPSHGFHGYIFRKVAGHGLRNPFNPFPMLRF